MTRRRTRTAVFRADASLKIGTGHVMRCLTLADALAVNGMECQFICAELSGHLADVIRGRGYAVQLLAQGTGTPSPRSESGGHSSWLSTGWEEDSQQVRALLGESTPDWLVVDHYAVDRRWEKSLADACGRLLVIDDLADRPHDCTLLLDQGVGRRSSDYNGLVGLNCHCLAGSQYALLRPEFREWRDYSMTRRRNFRAHRLLVTMGGVDAPNATGAVLEVLKRGLLPPDAKIDVVMSAHAPWLADIRDRVRAMPCATEVHVNPPSMARLMADSDLAIGAAGTTALERCCLGLPTLQVVIAQNQEHGAAALELAGACLCLGWPQEVTQTLPEQLNRALEHRTLAQMSYSASMITDGEGALRVVAEMERAA